VKTASVKRKKLTPPEVARRWGVSSDKVRAWIENGELRAINLAARTSGRPRYRIDMADVLAFERTREAKGVPPTRAQLKKATTRN
jgi:excisionase family DNA binding protein